MKKKKKNPALLLYGLVTKIVFNTKTVKNKIPDVSELVKKTDYNSKILDIEKKNILLLLIIIYNRST